MLTPGKIAISLADVSYRIGNKKALYNWINTVAESEGKSIGELSIILCSDEYLLDINKRFLKHDFYTDIITFDYTEGDLISGEMYISLDRVKDNAKQFNVDLNMELYRVLVHGVLHLCGFKDKTTQDAGKMRRKENEKLKILIP